MIRLAVLADDLTGALDTGVQFAALGCEAAVTVGMAMPDAAVAVCNLETRHLTSAEARARTAEATANALAAGAEYLYVKTDSGLRGNVGAALSALSGDGEPVLFAPSYPAYDRVTRAGIHYVGGEPVSRSLFGRDPLTPVRHDRVAEILGETGTALFQEVGSAIPGEPKGVLIADAETDEDLDRLAAEGLARGFRRFGGCAGFARALAPRLGLPGNGNGVLPSPGPLLILCGSVSPVSLTQLQRAEAAGLPCFRLRELTNGEGPLLEALRVCGCALAASAFAEADIRENDALGWTAASVAASLGDLARRVTAVFPCGLFVIGGDTLMGTVQALTGCALAPLREEERGVVLCRLTRAGESRLLITKSGSFGSPDTVTEMARRWSRPL